MENVSALCVFIYGNVKYRCQGYTDCFLKAVWRTAINIRLHHDVCIVPGLNLQDILVTSVKQNSKYEVQEFW